MIYCFLHHCAVMLTELSAFRVVRNERTKVSAAGISIFEMPSSPFQASTRKV